MSEFTAESKTAYRSDHRSPGRFILSHMKRHWLVTVGLLLGAFSNAALQSVVPIYMGQAFDAMSQFELGNITAAAAIGAALGVTVTLIISQFIRAVLQWIRNFSAETLGQRMERDVRDELYASLLGKSMSFHDSQAVGDIMARVTNDVRELYFMMTPGFNMVIGSGMFVILPLIVAPMIHPHLILVPLLFVIAYVYLQIKLIQDENPVAQKTRMSFGKMNSRLAEALDGLQVVKGSAQEHNEIARFENLTDTVRDSYIQQGEIEARYLATFLWAISFVAALIHAMLLYSRGMIEIGGVVGYIGQIYMFGFPVFTSLFSVGRVASGYASAKRILDIINAETDLHQNPEGYAGKLQGAIEFENVTFGYGTGSPVLKNVSFKVQPGQTVAFVGQTGAGKTTITKLINRLYDVQSGRVLVDGHDVRDWNLAALRSQIGTIEQDIFLFSRTIAENIGFSEEEFTEAQIIDAAKKAQAHDFIMQYPDGYDTKIGQRGVTLSGGQRQRVALARAFESDPPVLILDDSTSAIDSATEDEIQKAIWTAAAGRTTMLITHRLSQIRWADHIIVIKQGEVVAQGNHDDLLASSESYRRIFARYDEPMQHQASITVEQV
jgi:ATP-binding cassette subfamily B protein